jgi:dTDP-4-dehydrorhamnose 3,5-epimerase
MGAIYDVIIDMRPDSPAFKQWLAIELTAENRLMLYVPETFAHGFQTLADNSELFYQMSEFYHPKSSKGIRWNDPGFLISWPIISPIMSSADSSYPNY